MTKAEIQGIVDALPLEEAVALVRADGGLPFSGAKVIRKLRDKELLLPGKWEPTEEGRRVVGVLVGIPYRGTSKSAPSPKKGPPADGDQVKATAARDTICMSCNDGIATGEPCIWISEQGIYHPGCVQDPS